MKNRLTNLIVSLICVVAAVVTVMIGVRMNNNRKTYLPTTGVITKIDIVYGTGADDNDEYHVFVKYSVDGTEYEEELGEYSAGMHEGDDVDLLYNPDNPRQLQKAGLTSIIIAFVFSGLSILVAAIMFLRFLR